MYIETSSKIHKVWKSLKMAARIKKNAILKSAGIETQEFLKPNNCKVVKFVNISQRISPKRYNYF